MNGFRDRDCGGMTGEEKFRILAENIPGVVYLCDNDERYSVRYINDHIEVLTGYSKTDFMENRISFMDLFHPDVVRSIRSTVDDALRKRQPFHLAYRIRHRNGAWRRAEEWGVGIFDGGRLRFLEGFIADVTEKVQTAEMLRQAQKLEAMGRMAGGVAHDFNNLLNVIVGHAEMGLYEVSPNHPMHHSLREILKAARHSMGITQQLLDFVRIQVVSPQWLDLNETVEEMLSIIRRLVGKSVQMVWLPSDTPCSLYMDVSHIERILVNLCINAGDAIEKKGRIIIETKQATLDEAALAACSRLTSEDISPGEYVLLTVSDNGCGMDEETLCKVFEPFFTTKKPGVGTGLGLPTVYGIVKQNKGFIHMESEPGRGTTCKVFLPRHNGWRASTCEHKTMG